ncbi:2Fe-2S iron-sulfur cluster binding domain-containing protein [Ectobacillus ponti]|uniref:2Fe-2S iron-sulfur cluster binding domain-containing protein n=1 Tax=Ectobacillus ponti TaxID=2961894 RepID=A0AA41X7U3_9BACI|nr:2Fe-2S iron-sulfur cluster binding domain-containing protein [Ectobacillus ponti]MCP8970499.1 2Fe-2S iron-sulfur cluster binding domain-containing protein [Ectobacillus ponti]
MYRVTAHQSHADQEAAFVCPEDQTLLDAARSNGVSIPYACKGGGCGLCKILIEGGEYERGASSKAVLSDQERELHYSLACKTYPRSHLKIRV